MTTLAKAIAAWQELPIRQRSRFLRYLEVDGKANGASDTTLDAAIAVLRAAAESDADLSREFYDPGPASW